LRALVTGGAGFIGSHLCERLLADGVRVVCVDNFITGSRGNIEHLAGHPHFEFVHHDVVEPLDVEADQIFHLASPASPKGYYRHPLATALTNANGTHNLLELARRTGARFLITSTSEVYGEPEQHPQVESYWGNVNPNGPRACYDEGKRFAEALTMIYVREHGLDARIARLFNVYGPRMDPADGRLVPNFISQALRNDPLTIYGDGSKTRSLCYVSDLVEAIVLFMRRDNLRGEVVNLGNPEEHTVLEYAHIITGLVGSTSRLRFLDLLEDDPSRRKPDIAKAGALLGWQPRVGLEDGLRKTVDWFRVALASAQATG
jgi:nucleoside-diphosphate-sugar epimerase